MKTIVWVLSAVLFVAIVAVGIMWGCGLGLFRRSSHVKETVVIDMPTDTAPAPALAPASTMASSVTPPVLPERVSLEDISSQVKEGRKEVKELASNMRDGFKEVNDRLNNGSVVDIKISDQKPLAVVPQAAPVPTPSPVVELPPRRIEAPADYPPALQSEDFSGVNALDVTGFVRRPQK